MRKIDADEALRMYPDCRGFREKLAKVPTLEEPDTVQVVRCRDCKWCSSTVIGMPYGCFYEATKQSDTGEYAGKVIIRCIDPDGFCEHGERNGEE